MDLPSRDTAGFLVPPALAPIVGSTTVGVAAGAAPALESRLPLLPSLPIVGPRSRSDVHITSTPPLLFQCVGHSLSSRLVLLLQQNLLPLPPAAESVVLTSSSCSTPKSNRPGSILTFFLPHVPTTTTAEGWAEAGTCSSMSESGAGSRSGCASHALLPRD